MVEAAPLVSVIIRSMDPPTLPRALASVAAQDHPAIEVVLVAACGPSHRPVDASQYPFRLRFIVPERPQPRPSAANMGLDAAEGELITVLDHDDEFLPGHLSGLANALSGTPEYGASYCNFEVYEKGKLFVTVGHAFDRFALYEKSFIHHSAFMYRRSLLATGIRYDTALDIHDDWDFVLQLSEKTPFRYVDQATFRWHADIGVSGGGGEGNFDFAKYTTQRNFVHDKWAAVFATHVERWNAVVDRGMSALQAGNLDEAERNLREALADAENDADVLNGLAMIAYRRRDYARAKESIRRAIRARADDARLWFNYGLVCATGGERGEAKSAFERVRAIEPAHAQAGQWLARLA
jgi:glycosyltransferase involved in cell wall biosynthesis